MKKHRLGFVGAGRVADVHYAAIQALRPRAELAAFCDIRAEAVKARSIEWNVPGYASIDKMLDCKELDGVIVLLPHDVHLAACSEAAVRGIPILLEKPIALTVAEADEIISVCEENNAMLLVGQTGLFHPDFEKTVEIIQSGLIGKPVFAQAKSTQWLHFKPWDFRRSKAKTGGGCWMDCAGHLVYRLREIFGEVVEIDGMVANLLRPEMEGEDHASAVLKFNCGALAQITVSYGLKLPGYEDDWPQGCEQSLLISGDRGAVDYNLCPTSRLRLFSEVEGGRAPVLNGWSEQGRTEPFATSFTYQLKHFLDCAETGRSPRSSGRDALATLKVLTSLYEKLGIGNVSESASVNGPQLASSLI